MPSPDGVRGWGLGARPPGTRRRGCGSCPSPATLRPSAYVPPHPDESLWLPCPRSGATAFRLSCAILSPRLFRQRPDGPITTSAWYRRAQAVNRMTETKPNTNLVKAVAICLVAVLLTTSALWIIDHFRLTRHLLLGYLFVAIFIATFFGGIFALVTAFSCGLAAAFFLLPPQFSFYVDDPAQIKELIFTILLAVLTTAVVVGLTRGRTESSWWPP